MSIWKTNPPAETDYPIWAYTGQSENVVFIRSANDQDDMGLYDIEAWCEAEVPVPPWDPVRDAYEDLEQQTRTMSWTAYEWFRAGYRAGSKDMGVHALRQAKKSQSPFVDPEDFFEELDAESSIRDPNESAYDERV